MIGLSIREWHCRSIAVPTEENLIYIKEKLACLNINAFNLLKTQNWPLFWYGYDICYIFLILQYDLVDILTRKTLYEKCNLKNKRIYYYLPLEASATFLIKLHLQKFKLLFFCQTKSETFSSSNFIKHSIFNTLLEKTHVSHFNNPSFEINNNHS